MATLSAKEIEILIGELEVRLDRLRHLYEQYFLGYERLEPTVPRKDVDRRVEALRREQIRNTALRFRFTMTTQKYNTYQSYWQRICRQIEEGTFKRHLQKANQRFGMRAKSDDSIDVEVSFEADLDSMTAELEADFGAELFGETLGDAAPPAPAESASPPLAAIRAPSIALRPEAATPAAAPHATSMPAPAARPGVLPPKPTSSMVPGTARPLIVRKGDGTPSITMARPSGPVPGSPVPPAPPRAPSPPAAAPPPPIVRPVVPGATVPRAKPAAASVSGTVPAALPPMRPSIATQPGPMRPTFESRPNVPFATKVPAPPQSSRSLAAPPPPPVPARMGAPWPPPRAPAPTSPSLRAPESTSLRAAPPASSSMRAAHPVGAALKPMPMPSASQQAGKRPSRPAPPMPSMVAKVDAGQIPEARVRELYDQYADTRRKRQESIPDGTDDDKD